MISPTPPTESLRQAVQQVALVAFDFDGVFTDNSVYVFEDGHEAVRCWRSDGIGLAQLRRLGFRLIILSTEVNPVVARRSEKLEIECRQGLENKLDALEQIVDAQGLTPAQVAYVGNDINDLDCLKYVGVPIVVQDAHPAVLAYAIYQTNTPGGYGAVREICDLLVSVRTSQTEPMTYGR